MHFTDEYMCRNAIAYVKAEILDDLGDRPVVTLGPQDSPVVRSLCKGLLSTYLVDAGDRYLYVNRRHLLRAGVTEEQLHSRAVDNLLARAEERLEVRPYREAYFVLMGGDFEGSLLVADSFWETSVAHLCPHGVVVAAPARDLLAFSDLTSSEGVAELRGFIARAEKADHPLTPILLRRTAGSWTPYVD